MKKKLYYISLCLFMGIFGVRSQAQDNNENDPELTEKPALNQSVRVFARYEIFTRDLSDRIFFHLQYGQKIKNHDLLIRVNNMLRDDRSAFQYVVDFYPKFNEKSYGYFSAGYSGSELFPRFRNSAEVYRSFAKRWEFSGGLRTVHPPDYTIWVLTGTLGVYYGNWYTYVRPSFNLLDDGVSAGAMFVTRHYSGDGKSYLEVLVFRGEDRDSQRSFNAIENTFGLDTYLFRLKGEFTLNPRTQISAGMDYSGIFIPQRDAYIGVWSGDISFKILF